jgi:hypothetical protein
MTVVAPYSLFTSEQIRRGILLIDIAETTSARSRRRIEDMKSIQVNVLILTELEPYTFSYFPPPYTE